MLELEARAESYFLQSHPGARRRVPPALPHPKYDANCEQRRIPRMTQCGIECHNHNQPGAACRFQKRIAARIAASRSSQVKPN